MNQPRPLTVAIVQGRLATIEDGRGVADIASILDRWRITAEWWRDPIRRSYYRVQTASGAIRTIYYDIVHDGWFEQAY